MLEIKGVCPGGIGSELELRPGDKVIRVNGRPVEDLVDWYFHITGEEAVVEVETVRGELLVLEVEKDYDDDLGLEFAVEAKRCANKCVFCFIDQQPPGLRKTLYVKDDDYRLSFLEGNYVTLTNLRPKERERIIRQGLSPLYLSIHATDPLVRARLMGRRQKADILGEMRTLAAAGISFHGQIVLCPGYNDGEILVATLTDLLSLAENLLSLAVVPVGLTRHREGLTAIRPVDGAVARRTIATVDEFQEKFWQATGCRTVYAADEFYVLAGQPVPPAEYYEDFPQLENGVGMLRRMLQAVEGLRAPAQPVGPARVALVTGKAAADTMAVVARALGRVFPNLTFVVEVVNNTFLGETITVAGLLAGTDIAAHLAGTGYDLVLVPGTSLRAGRFIDDYTPHQLAQGLATPVFWAEDLAEVIKILGKEVG